MADSDRDRILDHNYDGIQEYDNPMPRWWLYIFWASIGFSILYFVYYHGGTAGRSIWDRYNTDMLAYYEKQAEELLKLGPITETTLANLQSDNSAMAGAAQVFAQRCASCHGPRAEGNIGPNLTDGYWLHGGRLTDVYRTVMEGVPEKGMLSWKKQLPVGQILAVSAYVGTLRGTQPPGAKAPQGQPFEYDFERIVAEEQASAPAAPAGAAAPAGTGAPAKES
jgi:cytochrome c oxidase cbb3-type subunit 3